ncbi:54S ribosomal protein L25, mitochondrial [[Candida] railenensis]|uniref:54S ribosomal protein L25, mitochondrial n=1 Tax=[Candida] railenensis TaxID=45579 RepID=A0A9P0QW01_9ASCO|nr:54S ribosomal protein L25, mitochondrial [[Candida] railenensis]
MSLTSKEAFAKLPQKLHNFFIKYPPRPFAQYASKPTTLDQADVNPFLPTKNPDTGRWRGAEYSLRRSADLYKLAKKFGIHELLPPIPQKRFHEDKYYNKNWMRGVLNPKKPKWERELPEKLRKREEALANMDETILAARSKYRKNIERREQNKKSWW